MISYLIVFSFTFQSHFITAIPVFPNNQVPGQPILPYPPGGFDLKSQLALLLQEEANNFQPYPPSFNNQFCPCQNQANNWNGFNQLDFNNILNNPVVQNLLGPNYNLQEDEIKTSGQLQNCPLPSKVPSVVNNYIVIPPEAFIKTEKEKPNNKGTETQLITNSSKNTQTKRPNNHKQGRRRYGNKKGNTTTVSTPKNRIDKEVEVFNETDDLNKKESLKIRPRKHKNNQNGKLKNCRKDNGVVSGQPNTCEAMNLMKENYCCPENGSTRHLVNDFNLMNFHQMFPFYPGFSPNFNTEGSQNQCCGNQMMYPDFSSFYNNPFLFDYQQLFNNPNENLIQNLEAVIPNPGNNIVNVQNKNRASKKLIPTVILNVKTVNADNEAESKTNNKEENTHESLEEDTYVDVIEDRTTSNAKSSGRSSKMTQLNKGDENVVTENRSSKKSTPTVIFNVKTVNADIKAESRINKKNGNTPDSTKRNSPLDLIEDKTTNNSKSSGRSAKMTQPNKKEEGKVTDNSSSKKLTPTVILNVKTKTDDVKAESKTNGKKENTSKSVKEDTPVDVIENGIINDNNKSSRQSDKMMQPNKDEDTKVTELPTDSLTTNPETATVKNKVEITSPSKTVIEDNSENLTIPNSSSIDNVSNVPIPEFSSEKGEEKIPETKDDIEEVTVPELGSEDEIPTLHENYIIEDYYPDFRNDKKKHEISESEDIDNLMDKNDQVDLNRERRKLETPLHDYNFFQQHHTSRNYYKLDRDPALNEISTTEDPKSKTFSEIETHTTLESSDVSEEIMYFITPPSLDKIDFETKQVNKKDISESLEDKETYDIKDKRFFVNSKSSTFSNAKVPYNHKPKKDKPKNTSPVFHNVETAYGHSKVATYGRLEQVEDTLDKPIENDYSSEISAEKPFIVMAQPVLE